jgi:hypothetical protein
MITKYVTKGSTLTYNELDANFRYFEARGYTPVFTGNLSGTTGQAITVNAALDPLDTEDSIIYPSSISFTMPSSSVQLSFIYHTPNQLPIPYIVIVTWSA